MGVLLLPTILLRHPSQILLTQLFRPRRMLKFSTLIGSSTFSPATSDQWLYRRTKLAKTMMRMRMLKLKLKPLSRLKLSSSTIVTSHQLKMTLSQMIPNPSVSLMLLLKLKIQETTGIMFDLFFEASIFGIEKFLLNYNRYFYACHQYLCCSLCLILLGMRKFLWQMILLI